MRSLSIEALALEAREPQDGLPHEGAIHAEELLEKILERLERIETRLAHYESLIEQAHPMLGMVGDTVDEWVAALNRRGIDLDARGREVLGLLERLTAPEHVQALRALVEQLPLLSEAAHAAPGLIATAVDTFDETIAHLRAQGVDVEDVARRLLRMARALLDSHVLDEQPVAVVSSAAQALAESAASARPASPLSLLRALGDPETQRALGFLLAFARAFGAKLNRPAHEQA
ncbi:MAG: DUF1641 domain-containing protein [Thermoflexales bacterium]|nr:DUF1641 domain-containing protein [Thermoflexales bacterium]